MPVLYVFGQGEVDVQDLASVLLSGPLSSSSQRPSSDSSKVGAVTAPPVLLLYDVTYAYAIPHLLETLGNEVTRDGRLVPGFPTPEAYSPLGVGASTNQNEGGEGGCGYGVTSSQKQHAAGRSEKLNAGIIEQVGSTSREACGEGGDGGCCSREGVAKKGMQPCTDAGGRCCGQRQQDEEFTAAPGPTTRPPLHAKAESAPLEGVPAAVDGDGGVRKSDPAVEETILSMAEHAADTSSVAGGVVATGSSTELPTTAGIKRRFRIGGLGVELDSEEELKRHTLVFVGGEGRQLSNVLMRCAGCVDRIRYDPSLPLGQRVVEDTGKGNKDLMRR